MSACIDIGLDETRMRARRRTGKLEKSAACSRSPVPSIGKEFFMRTRVTCGWLVGHADGHHTLWRNAELVYEGNSVVFVGERFEGGVDREIDARDKLVAPGFIDTHVHSGHRASHRLISDIGRGDYFGQPFLE